MRVSIGSGYRIRKNEHEYIDISEYKYRFTRLFLISLWEDGNGKALKSIDYRILNYEKFMPENWANRLYERKLYKVFLKLGIDIRERGWVNGGK